MAEGMTIIKYKKASVKLVEKKNVYWGGVPLHIRA